MEKKPVTKRKLLKLDKRTIRTLGEQELAGAQGGRMDDGPLPPSSVRTMNHNQALLGRGRRVRRDGRTR